MVDRIILSNSTPETCECAVLHGRRDFATVIKLGILKQGEYPGLIRWTQCNHKSPYKREAEVGGQVRKWSCGDASGGWHDVL